MKMNTGALFLFVILLLSLVLCSFLGGSNCSIEGYTSKTTSHSAGGKDTSSKSKKSSNTTSGTTSTKNNSYDNYNHYSGSSTQSLVNGTMFYGPNGATAEYVVASNGTATLKLLQTSGSSFVIFNSTPQTVTKTGTTPSKTTKATKNTFYGPSGFIATIIDGKSGTYIVFTLPNGTTQTFTQQATSDTINNSQYYGSTGDVYHPKSTLYNSPYPSSASAWNASGPNGNYVAGTNYNGPSWSNGLPASQIPPGQEDLYILKSEIVPPVCPACPSSSACPSSKKETCPPCPACARCPEPSFECKKVPNYDAINDDYLPEPVLNSFATF